MKKLEARAASAGQRAEDLSGALAAERAASREVETRSRAALARALRRSEHLVQTPGRLLCPLLSFGTVFYKTCEAVFVRLCFLSISALPPAGQPLARACVCESVCVCVCVSRTLCVALSQSFSMKEREGPFAGRRPEREGTGFGCAGTVH